MLCFLYNRKDYLSTFRQLMLVRAPVHLVAGFTAASERADRSFSDRRCAACVLWPPQTSDAQVHTLRPLKACGVRKGQLDVDVRHSTPLLLLLLLQGGTSVRESLC